MSAGAMNALEMERWRASYNPLRGLSAERCRSLTESFSTGQWAELMWCFGMPGVGIESADPDLMALIEKRTSALAELEWRISISQDKAQDPRAIAQQKALQEAYDRFNNLYAAIEALEMAAFRGIAVVEVDWNANELRVIEPWNLVRDGPRGNLAYNPAAGNISYLSTPEENRYDPARHWWLVYQRQRPIGAWALLKHFYAALAQRDWAAYCGIYGIPGGVVTGPPSVPDSEKNKYESAAEAIARGGSGFLPNGSSWTPNVGARGSQPFKEWLEFLSAKLVLAGTGGMLTMLNDATGLGSGQSQSHEDTFAQIAAGEARRISEIFQRAFDRRVLESRGLLATGERPVAYFEIAANEETDGTAVIDDALKLAQAGYDVDEGDLAEKTGYKIAKRPAMPNGGTALQTAQNGLQIAPNKLNESGASPAREKPSSAKLDELLAALDGPDPEKAIEKALKVLDTMTPADIGANEHAAALEKKLIEAVISGATGATAKQKPAKNPLQTPQGVQH
jgi:phage gp29-like protein